MRLSGGAVAAERFCRCAVVWPGAGLAGLCLTCFGHLGRTFMVVRSFWYCHPECPFSGVADSGFADVGAAGFGEGDGDDMYLLDLACGGVRTEPGVLEPRVLCLCIWSCRGCRGRGRCRVPYRNAPMLRRRMLGLAAARVVRAGRPMSRISDRTAGPP